MSVNFFRFSIAVLLIVFPSFVQAAANKANLLYSVVQILTLSDEGDAAIGSGSIIRNDGLTLTNAHVILDEDRENVKDSISICYTLSQFRLPRCTATAKVIAFDTEHDLALLLPDKKISGKGKISKQSFQEYWAKLGRKFEPISFKNKLKNALPSILDRITIWGYPSVGGSTITVTSGFVSGFSIIEQGNDQNVKFIKTDTAINPGNSGGAAFDKKFSFIGVPANAYPGQLGFIIPVKTAVEWMQSLDKKKVIDISTIESLKTYFKKSAK